MSNDFQEQVTALRRQTILEAAIALFAEQGFQRTTVKQIAQKAGVADGTIYNYFESKDALLMAVMAQFSEAEMRELDLAAAEQMPFAEFVAMYVPHRMQEVDEQFVAFKAVMSEMLFQDRSLQAKVNEEVYLPGFAVAEEYFAKLMAEGVLPQMDVVVLSRLFASPLMGLLLLRLLGDEHVAENWDAYTGAVVKLLQKFGDGSEVV
ncbi:MAG TPA: helix-turn-helix domain-containing protein [Anaerolineae bacterium]|nr:helix-turn-helix domain-containing protein [Anaerolineae bacterium]